MFHQFKRWRDEVEAKQVAAFVAEREPQSDEAFLRGCNLPVSSSAMQSALAIRRAIAKQGQVPAEFIHHDALFSSELIDLPFWDSLDAVGITLALEEELGIELSDEQLEQVRNPEHHQPNLKVSDFVADVLAVTPS